MAATVGLMRRHLLRVLRHRRGQQQPRQTRAQHERLRALERLMARRRPRLRSELARLLELAARYAPAPGKPGLPAEATYLPPAGDRKATPGTGRGK